MGIFHTSLYSTTLGLEQVFDNRYLPVEFLVDQFLVSGSLGGRDLLLVAQEDSVLGHGVGQSISLSVSGVLSLAGVAYNVFVAWLGDVFGLVSGGIKRMVSVFPEDVVVFGGLGRMVLSGVGEIVGLIGRGIVNPVSRLAGWFRLGDGMFGRVIVVSRGFLGLGEYLVRRLAVFLGDGVVLIASSLFGGLRYLRDGFVVLSGGVAGVLARVWNMVSLASPLRDVRVLSGLVDVVGLVGKGLAGVFKKLVDRFPVVGRMVFWGRVVAGAVFELLEDIYYSKYLFYARMYLEFFGKRLVLAGFSMKRFVVRYLRKALRLVVGSD